MFNVTSMESPGIWQESLMAVMVELQKLDKRFRLTLVAASESGCHGGRLVGGLLTRTWPLTWLTAHCYKSNIIQLEVNFFLTIIRGRYTHHQGPGSIIDHVYNLKYA